MFFSKTPKGYIIRVRLTPNSSSCRVNGIIDGPNDEKYLKANIIAVPEKGKANKELITFLAKKLGIAKGLLTIISGETNHWKKIEIATNQLDEEKLYQLQGDEI